MVEASYLGWHHDSLEVKKKILEMVIKYNYKKETLKTIMQVKNKQKKNYFWENLRISSANSMSQNRILVNVTTLDNARHNLIFLKIFWK